MQFVNIKHIKIRRYFDQYFVSPEHSGKQSYEDLMRSFIVLNAREHIVRHYLKLYETSLLITAEKQHLKTDHFCNKYFNVMIIFLFDCMFIHRESI